MSSPEVQRWLAGTPGFSPYVVVGVISAVLASMPAQAEEWSIAPVLTWTANHNSNLRLERDAQPNESTMLMLDTRFTRATENTRIYVEPYLRAERFTDSRLGNTDDMSLRTGITRQGERSRFELNGLYSDLNTLSTEIADTGLILPDAHRRTAQADFSGTYFLADSRAVFASVSYYDVSYYGDYTSRLVGYRYPSVSVGERFILSDRTGITVSVFSAKLLSDAPSGDSEQNGAQVGLEYAISEVMSFDASFGISDRTLAGQKSRGKVAEVKLSREMSRGRFQLGYSRNLVPYGYGVFVERQQLTGSGTLQVTPYVSATLTAQAMRNDQAVSGLLADRRSYDDLSLNLRWAFAETWTLNGYVGGTRAEELFGTQLVEGWRTGVGFTWTPFPAIRSR